MPGSDAARTALWEKRPNLGPLLRFLSSDTAPDPSIACRKRIRDAIEASRDAHFTRSYVHGVLFRAWLGAQQIGSNDVFASVWGVRLSTAQYGNLVVQCRFEKCMLQCLYLAEMPQNALEMRIMELCHCHPQLALVIFPYLDLLMDPIENKSAENRGASAEFAVEILSLGMGHMEGVEPVLEHRFVRRLAELLMSADVEASWPNRPASGEIIHSALDTILQKSQLNLPQAASILESLSRLKIEGKMAKKARHELRKQMKELSTSLSAANVLAQVEIERFGWLGWHPALEKRLNLTKSWIHATEEASTATDQSEETLMQTAVSEILGWAMSHIVHPSTAPLDCFQLQDMTILCMKLLKGQTEANALLFHSISAAMYSVLGSVRGDTTQVALLNVLGVSPVYLECTERIQECSGLAETASSRVICLCNQLMECGMVHEGEVTDKEQSKQHLSEWIDRIFPLMILFPHISLHQLIMNALLYDAQQPLLVTAVKHFGPILQRRPSLVLVHLREILSKIEGVPSENLSSFSQRYFEGENLCEKVFFLENICGKHLSEFHAPTSTAEGLTKGALLVVEAAEKLKWLVPPCLTLLTSLSSVFQCSCISGNSSHPSYQVILAAAEQLFGACTHTIASLTEAVTPFLTSVLLKHCKSLDWYQRVRLVPLITAIHADRPFNEDLESLFLPGSPEEAMETETEGVARAWMELLSQMFWFGSLSDAHCKSLCNAFQLADASGARLLDQISHSFVHQTRDLPGELHSWTVTMALVENFYTASAACIHRTLHLILPVFLQCSVHGTEPVDRDSAYMLSMEVCCRALYVLGSQYEMDAIERHCVLNQGQTQLAHFIIESLRSEISAGNRELFTLRSFVQITTLMTSMNATDFDGTQLQMLLIHLLQDLTDNTHSSPQGCVLSSGVSLHLVVEWIWSWISPLKPSFSNCLKLALNRVIKDKLEHL